ncbi:MAG: hypothetical protein DSY43_02570 [Gammaproteobacteria bacterium]|uniref:Outer-membrane lipoprotein LolB n=1 Tax=endosymbiont of Bathymodiolus septemdierum str. Myojin knoll TaxID=1303921 RepID=A0A0P0UST1_9GAMM|nr:lipoprotein insertase outer membrane protein LolB [Bathymodiolus septemdierum thioautotrophic gill symbiont]RUA06263.1 MAG: hypothetical protein DSY43_02570 [Gammaproteobacteria bacterium]BAS68068.1 conserved hypothetical protein [endosymbiont of Bathymodiolus septemdierum str. Myojin knoll]
MKTPVLLLLISLLSACSTVSERMENLPYSQSIPKAWAIAGRLSATIDGKTESVSFELQQQRGFYQLILTGTLGFGQRKVEQTQRGLLVDGKLMGLSLQEWMVAELGWYFPVAKLEQLVFMHDLKNAKYWQMKVSKYQEINGVAYPKIVRFKNTVRTVKIKLLLREINRLK